MKKSKSGSSTGSVAGYSGTPLVKKLGIKPGFTVALVDAPEGFEDLLVDLPADIVMRHSARGKRDLTIWFNDSASKLKRRVEAMARAVEGGSIWIAWPKKASGVATDVTEALVRKSGLDQGLVDVKICAIDETWSGLKFYRRKK